MKQVYELNEDGTIKEVLLMSDEEIENTDKLVVTEGWQDGLFEPRYDFEQEKWIEGLAEDEVQQRLSEIEEQRSKPSEQERIEVLESALLELILERDTID